MSEILRNVRNRGRALTVVGVLSVGALSGCSFNSSTTTNDSWTFAVACNPKLEAHVTEISNNNAFALSPNKVTIVCGSGRDSEAPVSIELKKGKGVDVNDGSPSTIVPNQQLVDIGYISNSNLSPTASAEIDYSAKTATVTMIGITKLTQVSIEH